MSHEVQRLLFEHSPAVTPTRRRKEKQVITYSGISMFQTCRRRFRYRHLDHLVPVERPHALRFGSVTHQWLEVWHRTRSHSDAQAVIDTSYPSRAGDREEKRDWHYQTAMLKAYVEQYPAETFEVVALECEFSGPLRNPAPGGRCSRSFQMRGKVDGIVRRGDEYLLLEHKTAASVTGDYIERLAMDLQILLYSHYARESLKYPVTSIIYNVLGKPRLVQGEGETEEQFEARKAELEAKSKSGKPSSAKRKLPESDEDFQARLADWFAAEPRFTRVELILDFDAVANVRRTLWDISKEILDARVHDRWHQNPRACFGFGKCAYWPICSSNGGDELVIQNLFTRRPPNEELSSDEEPEPTF